MTSLDPRFTECLGPILETLAGFDPNDGSAAEKLNELFPVDSPRMLELAELFARGVAEGWLCERQGAENVCYSRVRKAADDELSIDAVHMSGAGPGHTHPNGEFDLCFAAGGSPKFDGSAPGWVVYPPGSWHVPTVEGGTMNILYFLPGGAIEFGPKKP